MWAIGSSSKIFRKARLRLTGVYVAGILLVLALFSIGVYVLFAQNLDVDVNYQGSDVKEERALENKVASEAKSRLAITLIAVDLGAAGVVLVIGWLLAGSALKPLRSAFKRQKQFASDAAHELRTPLSVMKAGLETLEVSGTPPVDDFRELNKDMLRETNRLVELTNDLLTLAGIDSHEGATPRDKVDISVLADKQAKLMQAYARKADIKLKASIESGQTILAQSNDIERMILNLLKNAVDYNSKGGEVTLRVFESVNKIKLEVSDTGAGINSEQLKNVFNRFYKADAARERSDRGGGLGLSIVHELVQLHGAQINIESQVGVGTKVIVTFEKTIL